MMGARYVLGASCKVFLPALGLVVTLMRGKYICPPSQPSMRYASLVLQRYPPEYTIHDTHTRITTPHTNIPCMTIHTCICQSSGAVMALPDGQHPLGRWRWPQPAAGGCPAGQGGPAGPGPAQGCRRAAPSPALSPASDTAPPASVSSLLTPASSAAPCRHWHCSEEETLLTLVAMHQLLAWFWQLVRLCKGWPVTKHAV